MMPAKRHPRRAFSLPLLALLCSAWMLSSCSLLRGSGEDLPPKPSFKKEQRFTTLWKKNISGSNNRGRFRLSPISSEKCIYVASQEGEVHCLDPQSGRNIWRTDMGIAISSGVGVGGGSVLVGTQNGSLIALNTENGRRRWITGVGGEILSPPQIAAGRVLVQTLGGRMVALDAADGNQVWNYRTQMPLLSLRGTARPVLHEEQVILGLADGSLVALDRSNGALLWTYRVAFPEGISEIERLVDIDSTPQVDNGVLYAVSYGNSMVALRLHGEEQQLLWRKAVASHNDIAVDGERLYLSDSRGMLLSLDRTTGKTLWQQEALLRRKPGAPMLLGTEYLVVSDVEGFLYLIQRSDGRLVASTQVDSEGLRAALLTRDGVVYAYGNGGKLKALQLR